MNKFILIIDVESIGLYGEAFAVAGILFSKNGDKLKEFCFSCDRAMCKGLPEDREWVNKNVPEILKTHNSPYEMREAFWNEYQSIKKTYGDVFIFAESNYPVETNFFTQCVKDSIEDRKTDGPYPFHDISTYLLARGFNPLLDYVRAEDEIPKHHPLNDCKQSARLLFAAIGLI